MKILFVGFANSSHTHAWMSLVDASLAEVAHFAVSGTRSPDNINIRMYAFSRSKHSPHTPKIWRDAAAGFMRLFIKLYVALFGTKALIRSYAFAFGPKSFAALPEIFAEIPAAECCWLVEVIKGVRPDIIHTLGLEPSGFLFSEVRKEVAGHFGKWVATVRGRELTLSEYLPEERIRETLGACDAAIVDTETSRTIARKYCREVHRFPGTGGIEIPSAVVEQRGRIILWPKAHEFWGSKSLPVIEAFRISRDRILPCTIHMMAVDEETRRAVRTLPDDIRSSIVMHERIPREEMLALMSTARVMLAPSLSDGVPNVLYEAMGHGALPIVSPLETIREVAEDGQNCLFARNLYPEEIAEALVRAMSDDGLFLSVQRNNREKVRAVADRTQIAKDVREMYLALMPKDPEKGMSA